jgi:putative oxygen-independent coproporphyrinogen III oxidase
MIARGGPLMDTMDAQATNEVMGAAGIYLHVPYCKTLCPYCDFVKERARTAPDVFVDALCREIHAYEGPAEAQSIFFGGGTPSLLPPEGLERILAALQETFTLHTPEVTLEANPDDVTAELAATWRTLGINRISMGVQSFDDRVLRHLGRRHDAAGALRAVDVIAGCFEDWNLDFIFGAPPIEAWRPTLEQAVSLRPPHIAAYGLTYEAGTPFARRAQEAIDDETSLRLYRETEEVLAGYEHYEISNFCLPGRASRHNLVYWHNGPYAGFGTGAYSYLHGVRARNHATNDAYLRAPGEKMEALVISEQEEKVETLIQHFRLRQGLPKTHYEARFQSSPWADFAEALTALTARRLIRETATHLLPTREGFYLNNEIGLALVG